MNAMTIPFTPYPRILSQLNSSPLRHSEVPVEHMISLPLPTLRMQIPAYVVFACPAVRIMGQPTKIGTPDRWWMAAAQGGRLLLYALTTLLPFAPDAVYSAVTLPVSPETMEAERALMNEQKAIKANFDVGMDLLAPVFFAGDPGDAMARQALLSGFQALTPPPLQELYRGVAPDFFAWLEARPTA